MTDNAFGHLASLASAARELLVVRDGAAVDNRLWERAQRVAHTVRALADLPEIAARQPDRDAAQVAALFANAGWAHDIRNGTVAPWLALSRPTSEAQREFAVAALEGVRSPGAPAAVLERAADAIREYVDRQTDLIEAQLLADAENLDDIGLPYLLRQLRRYHAENRSLQELLGSWKRLEEYRYWDFRVNDGLRFEASRAIARERVAAGVQFVAAMGAIVSGADIQAALTGDPV